MKDDTVSRAAVMESLTKEYNRRRTGDGLKLAWIEKAVNEVPEVKTEIIRCKDCRYQDKGRNESESWNLCGYRPWLHVPTEDEHYCGYAEGRIDE